MRQNFFFFFLIFSTALHAQDDLMSLLGEPESPPIQATFKGIRVINGQSVEVVEKGDLLFVIEHRFGTLSSGAYELWGLDQASMRMSFDYGVFDGFSLSLARSSFQKTYESSAKMKLLRQNVSGGSPVSVTAYSAIFLNSIRWLDQDRDNKFSSRLSFAYQFMLARKFNQNLSLQITPSFVHRNIVPTESMKNDFVALGFGGRYKLSKRVSLNTEYFYQFDRGPEDFTNSLSIGFDIETGGHVFQLHLTNSQGMFERSFIGETIGKWSQGDIYFGFNISRVFSF
jgi:hypothetical protein